MLHKTVLVSGHLGRVGSALLARKPENLSLRGFDVLDGQNVLDYDCLLRSLRGCHSIVHLAGAATPRNSIGLADYIRSNVTGTYTALCAAVDAGVEQFIFASSIAVHGVEEGIAPVGHLDIHTGYFGSRCHDVDPQVTDAQLAYAASKAMAEQLVAWFGLTRRLRCVTMRLGPVDLVHMGFSVPMQRVCDSIFEELSGTTDGPWHKLRLVVSRPDRDS